MSENLSSHSHSQLLRKSLLKCNAPLLALELGNVNCVSVIFSFFLTTIHHQKLISNPIPFITKIWNLDMYSNYTRRFSESTAQRAQFFLPTEFKRIATRRKINISSNPKRKNLIESEMQRNRDWLNFRRNRHICPDMAASIETHSPSYSLKFQNTLIDEVGCPLSSVHIPLWTQ